MTTKIREEYLQERNAKICRLRKEGVTIKELMYMFHLSKRQIIYITSK